MELLEKQLQSWTPRPPSPSIKESLFQNRSEPMGIWEALRQPFFWRWVTPAMAGCLALVAFINCNRYHMVIPWEDGASYYATVLIDSPNGSNFSRQTYALNKLDVNLEMNVWATVQVKPTSLPLVPSGVLPLAVTNHSN